ncbi:SDR family oxidoreductase [Hymenobacter fodinae]|uniref:SDR family oxidoreductase n=1 Tax=Hymenobacter fodinae TaxID=2510796 RepID=A0A4Z0NZ22_9BACT|nr:SDR family oxidoreductase [Hymenobacter fodinae]TGE03792.1 SDR family oxidoreductase [Hymenobacter fodinae]
MSDSILVTGATGTVSSEVVKALASRGLTVRAGVRSIDKAAGLAALHPTVQLVELDYARPETVQAAFAGITRLFLLTPFTGDQVAICKQLVDAAQQASVQQVVLLSGAGADAQPGTQINHWHRAVEVYLQQSGLSYTVLRPSGFMQNFLTYNGDSIRQEDKFYLAIGDGRVNYIDVRDIAAVAAAVLTAPVAAHQGQIYTLTGPTAVSSPEVAAALSAATGRPISYVAVPGEAAAQALAQAPGWMRNGLLELYRLYKAGGADWVTPTVQEITQRPPYTIQQFAQDFRQQFAPTYQVLSGVDYRRHYRHRPGYGTRICGRRSVSYHSRSSPKLRGSSCPPSG